jgi:DNA-binding NtrC family response regulator
MLACALSSQDDDFSLDAIARRVLDSPIENKLDELERALVAVALELSHGNKTHAAQRLGVHRKVIERRVERHSRTATR